MSSVEPPRSRNAPHSVTGIVSLLALASIPLILLLLGQLLSEEFRQSRELRGAVDDSYTARLEVQRLLSVHQDIETGQRGYAITGDAAFLAPYERARLQVEPALRGVERHLGDRSPLREDVQALRRLSIAKLRFSEKVVRLRREGNVEAAVRVVAEGRGKAVMDMIRARIGRIDAAERRRLAASTREADLARMRSQRLTFILLAGLALLLFAAAWANHRSMQAKRLALRRLEDLTLRQESIFNSAKDGILTLSESGRIESLNPAAARMYGYEPSELLGREVGRLFENPPKPDEVAAFLKAVQRRRRGDVGRIEEFSGQRRDGSTFPADVAVSPVSLADGLHYVAVIRDISERKEVERMKSDFVSTVSHELRTPLTSIAGSLGLLKGGAAGALPERATKLVSIAHSNSERLVRLINDILDIEKIESGKMAFDVRPVPLRQLVGQAIDATRGYAAQYCVRLEFESRPEIGSAMADADRLMQVLSNLLSNAIKYSPPDGCVSVSVSGRGALCRISVADRGPGIPEEFRSRIFAKFAQADGSATREKGGTGLGLSIVREIVTRLGGEVSYEDRQGGGTVFHVDLPAAEAREATVTSATGGQGQPILLHIDDDDDVLRVVASAFEGKAFVTSATSIEAAREVLGGCGFDLVILDVALGDGSGLDLLPQIHLLPCRPPVVLFTARDADPELASQADAVLTKSRASLTQLVETVEALLQPAGEES